MAYPETHAAYLAWLQEDSPVVFLVRQEMDRGKKFAAALDHVCGEGSFAKLAEEIWHGCRARVELTAIGEQFVIPGCERKIDKPGVQLGLWD